MENIKLFDNTNHTNTLLKNFDTKTKTFTTTDNNAEALNFDTHDAAFNVWAELVRSQQYKQSGFNRAFIIVANS
jgi:hypothetical protein